MQASDDRKTRLFEHLCGPQFTLAPYLTRPQSRSRQEKGDLLHRESVMPQFFAYTCF